MNDIEVLNNRIMALEKVIQSLVFSDRYVFQKHVQFMDGRNIQGGKGTGTKIGTAANQKFAFYGTTPVIQGVTDGAHTANISTYGATEAYMLQHCYDQMRAMGLLS